MRRTVVLLLVLGLVIPSPSQAAPSVERSFVRSFDGTPIVYNLFIPDAPGPFPAVFYGHGWSGKGQTEIAGFVKRLLDNGYAVITWDARGFGDSGGESHVDDPAFEARDVSALIDMLASRPEIVQQAPGDPLIGMASGSYAGGIQLVTAAFDHRVDAITPKSTWNDLSFSLFPNDVVKIVLGTTLAANGLASSLTDGAHTDNVAGPQTGSYSPDLIRAMTTPAIEGAPDRWTLDWWRARSVAGYGSTHPIVAPTLLIQGIADPLFKVNEALRNATFVASNGTPWNLVLVCSSHGPCPYANDGDAHANDRIIAWFDRWLKHEATQATPTVEYIDNEGTWRSAGSFDAVADGYITATGSGQIVNTGADTAADGDTQVTRGMASRPGDPGTMTIPTSVAGGSLIAGVPHAHLNVTVAGAGTHLFLKLVDREANRVLNLQEMPVRIDGPVLTPASLDVEMAAVAYRLPTGHHLDVQIATSSMEFYEYRGAAIVGVGATVSIPVTTVADTTPSPTPTPTGTPTPEPSPGVPGTPQALPIASVFAAGRVPHANNQQVVFGAAAVRLDDGTVIGSFFARDPATTGASISAVGTVDTLSIDGDRAILEGPCDVAGDPDARCRVVVRDLATPGSGKDTATFVAPGYSQGGVIIQGDVVVQDGAS